MTPSDRPSRPTEADIDRLVDLLRGELGSEEAARLEARIAADPALAAERDALARTFALEARRFDVTEAAAEVDAPRLAAFILDRVARDEAGVRRREASNPRRLWAGILAASIAAHVLVLGFVAWQLQDRRPGSRERRALEATVVAEARDPLDEAYREAVAKALSDMAPAELEAMPDEVFRFDAPGDDPEPVLDEMVFAHRRDGPRFAHPRGMGLALGRRGNETLKRRRLDALGIDSDGTLIKVRLGLGYLEDHQRADGSFAGDAGTGDVAQTALAVLPFLGEGRFSLGDDPEGADGVVAKAVGYLRDAVFDGEAVREGLDGRDAGVALMALAEDYMLGYGRLDIEAARVRLEEIGRLGTRVRADANSDAIPADAWTLWALDAAERTGALELTDDERGRFDHWVSASLPAGAPVEDAAEALSQGTALLRFERGSDKPRFVSWSRESTESLLARLLPNGKAKGSAGGPRLRETAELLLALQVAYRTY